MHKYTQMATLKPAKMIYPINQTFLGLVFWMDHFGLLQCGGFSFTRKQIFSPDDVLWYKRVNFVQCCFILALLLLLIVKMTV